MTEIAFAKVKTFYLREDNSRVVPGIITTVTKAKKKKQNIIFAILWKIFKNSFCLKERPNFFANFDLSGFYFQQMPTGIVMYLRKVCKDIELKASLLANAGVLNCGKVDNIVKEMLCDKNNYMCM